MNELHIGYYLCMGVLFFIVAMIVIATNVERRQEMRSFARHMRGQLRDGGLFGGSQIELDFGGVTATLDFSSNDDASFTHLTVPLQLPLGRLKLRPQRWGDQVGKFLGMEDIEIGVPSFDEAFVIQGSNPREITRLLDEPVRAAITSLRRLRIGFNDDVNLDLGSGVLRITVDRQLSTEKELSLFATRCRALFDLLQPNAGHGIEFIDEPRTQTAVEADCLVCGSPLKDGIVHCVKCKTPHHRDCWHYFGSCAVYGCGQTRFVEFGNRS